MFAPVNPHSHLISKYLTGNNIYTIVEDHSWGIMERQYSMLTCHGWRGKIQCYWKHHKRAGILGGFYIFQVINDWNVEGLGAKLGVVYWLLDVLTHPFVFFH